MTLFSNQELVLGVKSDYDPSLLRLDRYEAFIDALCGDREYQKHAIRTVCRFLGGGQYVSTSALAEENFYASNAVLGEKYGSLDGLLGVLPFPDRLACCVDLATGTGKSWVMYGVARILLAEGVVDRVLVLCPSLTIESGLGAKFKASSRDRTLRQLLPSGAVFANPEITDANSTTGPGDICIENIDATYKHVRSSVRDSFLGKGATTLVLNDEAHHVFSPPTGERSLKRWKEFLDDPDFGFERIVGVSGTCYIDNDYSPDVVSRYSLRQAMEEGRVKEVRYVSKDESLTQQERFQKYLQLHRDNAQKHRDHKPLSILVASRVAVAQELARELAQFLAAETGAPLEEVSRSVISVTSHRGDRANVAQLPYVDRSDNPVEWITSVSKLTEGWDVQNVFQVIPHEKRAFASKLLIAQVLGRGLRVPPGMSRPAVSVFNHSSWSHEIARLVDEVLEQERRLHSYPVDAHEHARHHFELHHLSYNTRTTAHDLTPKSENGRVQLFTRGYINFETQPEQLERTTTFSGALDAREYVHTTSVHYTAYTVDDVVRRLRNRLKSIDDHGKTAYSREYSVKQLRAIIEASLDRIGETRGLVLEQNLQHAYRAMGNTQRRVTRAVRIESEPDQLFKVSTRSMRSRSSGIANFRQNATVFYDSESAQLSEDIDSLVLSELADPDAPYPRHAARLVENKFDFKSPVNVVLTSHAPEREFVRRLFEPGVAGALSAWVKASDSGFYEVEFSWRKGDHTKQGRFNPDLFLKLANERDVLVIELKDDADVSDENRAKLRYAREHFDVINALQSEAVYHMHFVSPQSYDGFFQSLRGGTATIFRSALQASLED